MPHASPTGKAVNVRGGIVIVDADVVLRAKRRWRVHSDGYVRDANSIALHREITSAPAGMVVDHINGDPLDNRRENLRVCEHRQNLWNGKPHRDGSSQYRGVSWSRHRKKWRAQIQGKTLGHFDTETEAALAYNAAAADRFGQFARPNMVPGAGVEPARA
jgi:hypothetical protein